MSPPAAYDPDSALEQPVPLPNAPIHRVNDALSIQPPLTRRGRGPGLLLFLASGVSIAEGTKPLDPEPVQKWAEEGFAVAFVDAAVNVSQILDDAIQAFADLGNALEIKDKVGVVVYDCNILREVVEAVGRHHCFACIAVYHDGEDYDSLTASTKPVLLHSLRKGGSTEVSRGNLEFHTYPVSSPYFVLPHSDVYDPGNAALAHTRTLVFLRKHVGGPEFDREGIWEEHTRFEFEVRSVAKTMGTMVSEPYVNHIPTMTGGVGRDNLTRFYRDHFIFSNPADARLQTVSRTVGPDRVVDEFVYHITHDRQVDWLLPGVPATHKKLSIPMLAVVNIRGDRLYNEHIWWDQATALKQAGLLQEYVAFPTPEGAAMVRLPVAGVECAAMLLDQSKGRSNEMLSEEWGQMKKTG